MSKSTAACGSQRVHRRPCVDERAATEPPCRARGSGPPPPPWGTRSLARRWDFQLKEPREPRVNGLKGCGSQMIFFIIIYLVKYSSEVYSIL